MGQTGIRHTGDVVHIGHGTALQLFPGHDLAVAAAHHFHIHAFIVGVGIAIVAPQEGTDLHFIAGGCQLLIAVGSDLHDLTGSQVVAGLVAQLLTGKRLHGHAATVLALTHNNRQAAHSVTGSDQTIGRQQQNGAGAFDQGLCILNAVHKVIAPVDEGRDQLCGIDLTGGHSHKVMAGSRKGLGDDILGIVDDAHISNRKHAKMAADQQGLGIRIGDTANTHAAVHFIQVTFKFRTEGGIFDVMDLTLEAGFRIIEGKTTAFCSQVGMVVRTKENIILAVFAGNSPKKTTHVIFPPYSSAIPRIGSADSIGKSR